jgi:hypothetical protein
LIGSALHMVRETDLVLTLASPFSRRGEPGPDLRVFDVPIETPMVNIYSTGTPATMPIRRSCGCARW